MSSVSLDFNIYSKKLQRLYIWYRNYTRFLQLFQFVLSYDSLFTLCSDESCIFLYGRYFIYFIRYKIVWSSLRFINREFIAYNLIF